MTHAQLATTLATSLADRAKEEMQYLETEQLTLLH